MRLNFLMVSGMFLVAVIASADKPDLSEAARHVGVSEVGCEVASGEDEFKICSMVRDALLRLPAATHGPAHFRKIAFSTHDSGVWDGFVMGLPYLWTNFELYSDLESLREKVESFVSRSDELFEAQDTLSAKHMIRAFCRDEVTMTIEGCTQGTRTLTQVDLPLKEWEGEFLMGLENEVLLPKTVTELNYRSSVEEMTAFISSIPRQ